MMRHSVALLAVALVAALVSANVPVVSIDAPQQATHDTDFGVAVQVHHLNPAAGHYIDWIRVYAGGEIVAEMNFSSPQSSTIFSEPFTIRLNATAPLHAEAHCIVHGIASSSTTTVTVVGIPPTPTPLDCRMSLCDCQCYPAGQTPEDTNGVVCGINCLGELNATGCEVRGGACAVTYVTPPPTPVPTPTPAATVTPAPPMPTPTPEISSGNTMNALIVMGAIVVVLVIGAYFLLARKAKPPESGI